MVPDTEKNVAEKPPDHPSGSDPTKEERGMNRLSFVKFFFSNRSNLLRIMMWDEDAIMAILRSINECYCGQNMCRTFDVARYFDSFWFPGRGLLREWLGNYVHAETDDIVDMMERSCGYALRDQIWSPRTFFHVKDGDKARILAVRFLLDKEVPIKENALYMHATGACVDFGCDDYEGAFVNAQALHVCRVLGCLDCLSALETGGADKDGKDFLNALFDAITLQARTLSCSLTKRLAH
jgi:hypothetical protein